jgi:hypothetical protein
MQQTLNGILTTPLPHDMRGRHAIGIHALMPLRFAPDPTKGSEAFLMAMIAISGAFDAGKEWRYP